MNEPIRIHIRSYGPSYAQVSVTDQDGRDVGSVISATWSCVRGELAKVTLELEDVAVDVQGFLESA